jgi:hypothetical protein
MCILKLIYHIYLGLYIISDFLNIRIENILEGKVAPVLEEAPTGGIDREGW